MLCFCRLRSTIYWNISKQIQQGSTIRQGLARWWERELERIMIPVSQCYRNRACILVKTLGHVQLTVPYLATFANWKISIRRNSDMVVVIGDMIKIAAFYRILITWTSNSIPEANHFVVCGQACALARWFLVFVSDMIDLKARPLSIMSVKEIPPLSYRYFDVKLPF